MHHISEFLDLDAESSTSISEFVALIQAIREGLGRVESGFAVADYYINILFLTKLEALPEWTSWARFMLRDSRVNASDYSSERMPFHELADLAMRRETELRAQTARNKEKEKEKDKEKEKMEKKHDEVDIKGQDKIPRIDDHDVNVNGNGNGNGNGNNQRLQSYTQEEINSFVVRQMQRNQPSSTAHSSNGHTKRPSQEEINDFVVRQMWKEQERETQARSTSEPNSNRPIITTTSTATNGTARCEKCGDEVHLGRQCHSNTTTRTVAVIPRANFLPKKVEFRNETPGELPVYHTSFALT